MKNNISEYFSKKAFFYNKNSKSIPWKYIRSNELKNFRKILSKKKFKDGLDLGSGAGFYTNILKKKCKKIYAVDYSRKMLKSIKDKKILKIQGNASNIRLNKRYDVLICMGVFEFNKNYEKIFETIKQHSHKTTEIIILIPYKNLFSYFYYFFHKLNGIELNIYSNKDIDAKVKKNFIIKKKVYIFPFSIIYKVIL